LVDVLEGSTMGRFRFVLALSSVLAALGACAADTSDGTTPEDLESDGLNVGVIDQELDSTWVTGPFVQTGGGTRSLELTTTHVCVLTRVAGKFQGQGEEIRLRQVSGRWQLSVLTQQEGVAGEAHCFAKSKFLANGSTRWNGGEFQQFTSGSLGCASRSSNTWQGDAATFITGMGGKWEGDCEFIRINPAPSATSYTTLTAATGQFQTLNDFAYAHAFFAGSPGAGVPAKFWRSGSADEFTLSSKSRVTSIVLAPTSEAMCHLTGIKGDFNGGGEFVELRAGINTLTGVESWILKVRSGSGLGVEGTARCYLRDQR
jgi:hypothetical protein